MFKFLVNSISRSLEFSKAEAKGTLALIFIIIASIIASRLYATYLKDKSDLNPTDKAALEEWVSQVQASVQLKKEEEQPSYISKSDYLPIETKTKKKFEREKVSEKIEMEKDNSIVIEDLNYASKESLQKVRGIGPAFSERIIKYRELLGGFSSPKQLSEVYGLKQETVNEILKHFEIQTSPRQIQLNSDSAKILASHPYITYDLAWNIINYRKQHGDIKSLEDLKNIKSIDPETIEKLRPYLD